LRPQPTRRRLLFGAGTAAALSLVGGARWTGDDRSGAAGERRPNIVLILADDLGQGELGCYGQRLIRTPRLDRLAAQGLRFTDFYAPAPVCAPSRASLLTGLHCGHSRIRENPRGGTVDLTSADVTIATLLREAGYRTGLFGKWGFGPAVPHQASHPNAQGFAEFFGYLTHREAHRYYPSTLWHNERLVRFPGNMTRRGSYAPDRILERALDFIQRHRAEPFFMLLAPPLPHAPSVAPGFGPYADQPWAERDKLHAAQVTILDQHVGRIVDTLRELRLADDTIVLFTSDNGPHEEDGVDPDFFAASGGLRGYKRSLYEGGIRVPFLAWSPRLLGRTAGAVIAEPTAGWDLLPTLLDLTGTGARQGLDGRSLRGLLTGAGPGPERNSPWPAPWRSSGTPPPAAPTPDTGAAPYLYWVRPRGVRGTPRLSRAEDGRFRNASAALRSGNWKLVGFAPGREYSDPDGRWTFELYDLQADPGETTDVAARHPDVVGQCREHLRQAWVPLTR
jgi:arylsulfatase A